MVSAAFGWSREKLGALLRDQASLSRLLALGERLGRDAAGLLDRAAEGEQIPSATLEAEVGFASLCAPGNELTAVWARKSEKMRGTARV